MRFHLCSFSVGLDSLRRRQQADPEVVIAYLRKFGRFSCFEASANPVIANTMTYLCRERLMTENAGYPWTKVIAIDGLPLSKPPNPAAPR